MTTKFSRIQIQVTPEIARVLAREQDRLRRSGHPSPSLALAASCVLQRQASLLPKPEST